jgi:integrase
MNVDENDDSPGNIQKYAKTWNPITTGRGSSRRDAMGVGLLVRKWLGREGARCEIYLRDAVTRWIRQTCAAKVSQEQYAARFATWVTITGRRSIGSQVTTKPDDITEYLAGMEDAGRAQRTVKVNRDILRSWFAWLERRGLIECSPVNREHVRRFRVDQTTIVRGTGVRSALTLEQADRALAWAWQQDPEVAVAVTLQMTGGLRSAEVARVERRHLSSEPDGWWLSVPGKGQKIRRIRLEMPAVAALRRYLEQKKGEHGPILRSPRGGGHYTAKQVRRWAKAAVTAAGRPELASHDLRRTAATLLDEAGARLDAVQRHLGHSSPELTLLCYVTRLRPVDRETGITTPATREDA